VLVNVARQVLCLHNGSGANPPRYSHQDVTTIELRAGEVTVVDLWCYVLGIGNVDSVRRY